MYSLHLQSSFAQKRYNAKLFHQSWWILELHNSIAHEPGWSVSDFIIISRHKILEVCSYRIVLSLLTPLEQVPEQAPWTNQGLTGCEPESWHSNIANQRLKSLALKSQSSQVLGRRGGQDALFRQLEWKKGEIIPTFSGALCDKAVFAGQVPRMRCPFKFASA